MRGFLSETGCGSSSSPVRTSHTRQRSSSTFNPSFSVIPAFAGMTDFPGTCFRLDRGNNGSSDFCNNRVEPRPGLKHRTRRNVGARRAYGSLRPHTPRGEPPLGTPTQPKGRSLHTSVERALRRGPGNPVRFVEHPETETRVPGLQLEAHRPGGARQQRRPRGHRAGDGEAQDMAGQRRQLRPRPAQRRREQEVGRRRPGGCLTTRNHLTAGMRRGDKELRHGGPERGAPREGGRRGRGGAAPSLRCFSR